jgi:hypothetical protein
VADYNDKLTAAAGDQLEPGEAFVAGTFCLPKGGIRRQALFTSFGALGAAAGTAKSAPNSHTVAGQKLPKQLVLGLTDRRLFVFTVTAMAGRPNKIHSVVPLAQITGIDAGKGRSIGIKQLNMEIAFTDGTGLAVEVPRVKIADGQRFAEALAVATAGHGTVTRIDAGGTTPPPPPS